MLATWLVELYLAKINQLEDLAAAERASEDAENLVVERTIVEEDMRHFLSTYKVSLAEVDLGVVLRTRSSRADRSALLRRTTSTAGPLTTSSSDMVATS